MRKSLMTAAAIGLALCLCIAGLSSLWSQTFTNPVTLLYLTSSTGQPIGVSPQNPLPVTASVSVGSFNPSLSYNTCTATGSSCSSTAIPTNTGSVVLFNTGTTTVSCTLASGAATALASEIQIPASSWIGLATTGYDHYACIDQSGSTSNVIVASGGSGLPAGAGGGGSGSAITNYALETGGNLASILSAVQGAIPAGTNLIGKVGIDQTTPGTTNGVDPTTKASWGIGATGAAAPANGVQVMAKASGATGGYSTGLISCDSHVFKHITSATDTLLVQGVASQVIYSCGWRSRAAGVATWYIEDEADANANCSNLGSQLTGIATEAANTGEVAVTPFFKGFKGTSGHGLCIKSTGTGGVDIDFWYAQF